MRRLACVVHGGAGHWRESEAPEVLMACRQAVRHAWEILVDGGGALAAVAAAVAVLEDSAMFNAGLGSILTEDGTVEMDASVMEGKELKGGAVALVRAVRHPVKLAVEVLKSGREVLLAGAAADQLAQSLGLEMVGQEELVAAAKRRIVGSSEGGGTVGAVAVDREGNVAAATSTGGRKGKRSGRVGDSPILGAATYADNRGGAASATGDGEAILRFGLARYAVLQMERGLSPTISAAEALREFERRVGGEAGIILVDPLGRVGTAHNTPAMPVALMTSQSGDIVAWMSACDSALHTCSR
ncbi:MAG: isoaspartyl peptidase/L-asparaginase [Candidatus Binatia bacterium]|nr:isoaspartyl peptidase/L-asparaginase [Candidatus Binatia bacterium]